MAYFIAKYILNKKTLYRQRKGKNTNNFVQVALYGSVYDGK